MDPSIDAGRESGNAPAAFVAAVESLRDTVLRPEVCVEPAPPPKRLAPYAYAMTADIDQHATTGRLVLLHDPAGHHAWHGEFRLVTYVRSALDPEMASDPLLPSIGWTWLIEALGNQAAPHTAASGTVTRVASESFGGMADEPATADIEIRASWTPLEPALGPHVRAWGDVLVTAAGLLPLPPGVVAMPSPRGGRRS